MEYLIFILLIIVIILLIGIRSHLNSRINEMHDRFNLLSDRLAKLTTLEKPSLEKSETTATRPVVAVKNTPLPAEQPRPEKMPEQIQKLPPVAPAPKPIVPPLIPPSPKPAKPGFLERNPDMEKFIGENLANKIGIAILVLGIGFFVKYAIDQEWIGVYGRVLIGLLCGGILLCVAHKMRASFPAFGSVLVGGGIAVLYLTITIAFQEYNIIGQIPAFLIMVAITAFTILLSIAYDRKELAILALLGGFGSPFMVSTGEGNYVVLFTYVLILDAGILVLAYFKRWHIVNIIAYIFTIILFGSWLGVRFEAAEDGMIAGGMTFATLFYLSFFAMNIVNNLKERTKFNTVEISLLLSNTFLYYAAGMHLLNDEHTEVFRGLFTALIGVFNFIFAYTFFKTKRADKNLVYVLIGLVLTFISLAAPVQLEGNYITMFWAAEAVLLLWLSQQSGIRLMKLASVIVTGLMLISLTMDWVDIYGLYENASHYTVVANKGFITTLFSFISLLVSMHFVKVDTTERQSRIHIYRIVLTFAAVAVAYIGALLELHYQLSYYVADFSAIQIIIGTYNMAFILGLIVMERRMILPEQLRVFFPALGILAMVIYFAAYHRQIVEARNLYIQEEQSFLGFGFHYLLMSVLLVISVWSLRRFRLLKGFNEYSYNAYSWVFVFFFLFIASAELDHTVVLSLSTDVESIDAIVRQNHKIGYPILWGVSSFLLIAIGLRKKRRHLRIISLTLFLVTLLKLFLVDIRGISQGGLIAAFISLGLLLLIVSFMYQRLKKFLLEDEQNSALETESSINTKSE
jgi:uncharacterized membrane protein